MKINIERELLESLYYGNDYTLQDIADIFGCSSSTIWWLLIEYDIKCRSRGDVVTDFTFSNRQRDILEGCMLGDGGLVWVNNNCFFGNTDIHEDYLIWLHKQLGVEDISRISPVYRFVGAVDPYEYVLKTRVIPSIREEHKRWYPYETRHGTIQNNQPKIIPKDIELSLTKVLFWYIGDGNYSIRDDVAVFCTSLVFDDWLHLSNKIYKVLDVGGGISINKQCKDSVGTQRYKLRLNRTVTNKFFDMVDDLDFDVPKCYHYKFGMY